MAEPSPGGLCDRLHFTGKSATQLTLTYLSAHPLKGETGPERPSSFLKTSLKDPDFELVLLTLGPLNPVTSAGNVGPP